MTSCTHLGSLGLDLCIQVWKYQHWIINYTVSPVGQEMPQKHSLRFYYFVSGSSPAWFWAASAHWFGNQEATKCGLCTTQLIKDSNVIMAFIMDLRKKNIFPSCIIYLPRTYKYSWKCAVLAVKTAQLANGENHPHPSSSSDGSKRRFKLSDVTGPGENFPHFSRSSFSETGASSDFPAWCSTSSVSRWSPRWHGSPSPPSMANDTQECRQPGSPLSRTVSLYVFDQYGLRQTPNHLFSHLESLGWRWADACPKSVPPPGLRSYSCVAQTWAWKFSVEGDGMGA